MYSWMWDTVKQLIPWRKALLLLLLLVLHPLCDLASSDDLGLLNRGLVWTERGGHEHANMLLVLGILVVLAGSDTLGKPRRSLE